MSPERFKKEACPFCEFDKQTEFFYYDRWKNIIICRDKNNLNFKYRLLAVRVGYENHKSMPTTDEREELLRPLIAIASAHVRNGQASGYDIDEKMKSFPSHYHYQANME